MGSQNSSSNSLNKSQNKKEKNKNYGESDSSSLNFNDSSSYKGLKTETTSINGNSLTSNSLSEKNENSQEKINEIKIPTLFEWKEGGNNVIITGSFCGWNHNFAMGYNEKSKNYELSLYLPKGEYQFKFIVDNVWKCSNFYEKVVDNNNNVNNVLNNSKQLVEKIKENNKDNHRTADSTPKNNHEIKNNTVKKINNFKTQPLTDNMRKIYGNIHPKKEQLNEEPPCLPQNYISLLNFSNFSSIGEEKFLYNIFKNNLIRETFKSVRIPTHVYLNHIFMNNQDSPNYLRINTTIRIKSKFASIIYFHPKL